MAINFPTSLDTLTNPTSTSDVATVDHATQHSDVNDAVEALEAKVGINSSAVTSSHDYKLSEVTDKAVGKGATQTLTNKRITVRIGTETSSSTSTPTADTVDQWNVTALAAADAFAAPSGTPTDGQKLIIRIKDNGTARALSWNAIYRASSDLALPTTTVINKTLYLGFIYNSADAKWDLVALLNNF